MNDTMLLEPKNHIQPQRLSECPLWQAQRHYFIEQGIEAWRKNIVPSYITTNPFIAHRYAQVVLGYVEDVMDNRESEANPEVMYILELGAGSGKFAFHFLKSFHQEVQERYGDDCPFPRICYVMTDIVPRNIQFWQQHEQLQPFVDQELLDFALFDACEETTLSLEVSGKILNADTLKYPVVVIANYVFDGLPIDVFEIKDNQLYACPVSLHHAEGNVYRKDECIDLDHVKLKYHSKACDSDYYHEAEWNKILRQYQNELKKTAFSFPIGALRCLKNLHSLSQGQYLLLTGDKGVHYLRALDNQKKPELTRHGSFSLSVNYHAMAKLAQTWDAEILQSPHLSVDLNILAFLFDKKEQNWRQIRNAFCKNIIDFGPEDFFQIKKATEQNFKFLNFEQIQAFLRLSFWDSTLFNLYHPQIIDLLSSTPSNIPTNINLMLQKIGDNHFFIGESPDLAFRLGAIFFGAGYYNEALTYFTQSLNRYGADGKVYYNKALSYLKMKRYEFALEAAKQAYQCDPNLNKISSLIEDIRHLVNESKDKSLNVITSQGLAS